MCEALNQDYDVHEEIGRGRFGAVYRCTSRITGATFAVKAIDKSLTAGDSLDGQCLLIEPKILHHLSPHPHIVNLYSSYEDDSHLHMILDFCPNRDLYSLIIATGTLPETQACSFFVQLIRAIVHCHSFGVVHRDIKPDNILLDAMNMVKIADFGSGEVVTATTGGSQLALSGVVGTPYYVAPEVLMGREYGEKVDVWSAGVVLYIMLAGFPPFCGETAVEIFEAVLRGNLRFPTRVFQKISPGVKDLLRRMICRDECRRLSAEQVLGHPWLASVSHLP